MKLLLVSLLLVAYGAIFVFTKGKFRNMSRTAFIYLIVFSYFKSWTSKFRVLLTDYIKANFINYIGIFHSIFIVKAKYFYCDRGNVTSLGFLCNKSREYD